MNLLEHYIREIYKEEPYEPEFLDRLNLFGFVKVKYKYDCYGVEHIVENIFEKDEWEEIKKRGYYLG